MQSHRPLQKGAKELPRNEKNMRNARNCVLNKWIEKLALSLCPAGANVKLQPEMFDFH